MNYFTTISFDPNLRDGWTLDASTMPQGFQGLVKEGVYIVTGAPATIAGRYMPSAKVYNLIDKTWYINTGNTASPVWTLVEVGSPLVLPTGEIFIGNGSNVPTPQTVTQDLGLTSAGVATVKGLEGMKLATSVGTPFTNEIIQYSGNSSVGYVNAAHKNATASSGVATMPGSNNGTNDGITTESLTTAAGSTVTLQVIDGQFTSSSRFHYNIRRGTATTGIPYVVSYTQAGGSVTFTIANIDPAAAFNGTLIMNLIAF